MVYYYLLLPTTYYLLLTTYYLPLTTYHLPLTTYHLLQAYISVGGFTVAGLDEPLATVSTE